MTAAHLRESASGIDSVGRQISPERSPFVGRDRELGELLHAIAETEARRGALFFVVGEPGIGKTRLATELARAATERGVRVLWGRCWEGEGAPAFWPWIQILRAYLREADADATLRALGPQAAYVSQVVPETSDRLAGAAPPPTAIESEHARFLLFDAITALLVRAAETKPVVLLLDDLHWADKPSLLLLQFVARALPSASFVIVGTYREADVRRSPELMDVLATVGREARHLPLRGLDEPEVARVIEAIASRPASPALVRTVREATEGNPYFVDELVRLLAVEGRIGASGGLAVGEFPVPQGVREAIRRRLHAYSAESRRLVSLASVVGREFEVAVLQRASGLPLERVLELLGEVLATGMLLRTSAPLGRFAFSHALVRETLYDDLAPADRSHLHGRVAEALEGLYSANPEPHVAELAHHFLRAEAAGAPEKAIGYALAAGRRARQQLAYEEGALHFARAVELMERLERPDERALCEALLALGEAQWEAGDAEAARRTFLGAGERIRSLRDPLLLAHAAIGYMGLEGSVWAPIRPPFREEIELLEGALAELPEEELALRARLMGRLAEAFNFSRERERMAALATEGVALARRSGDRLALIDALRAYEWTVAAAPDRAEERIAVDTEIIALASRGEQSFALLADNIQLHARLQLGRTEGLAEDFERHLADLEAAHRVTTDFNAALLRAMRALLTGAFGEVESLASRALEVGQRSGPEPALSVGAFAIQIAYLRREQGRLEEILETVRVPAVPGLVVTRCLLAWVCAELGREEEARAVLDELGREGFETIPRDMFWLLSMAALAEAVIRLEDADRAAIFYEALLPFAGQVVFLTLTVCTGSVSRLLGGLASLLGRHADAERHFEEAVALNSKLRAAPWVARTRYEFARMLWARDESDDRERSAKLLEQAIGAARGSGMEQLLKEAEAFEKRTSRTAETPAASLERRGAEANVFRREGAYWKIAFRGESVRVKDTIGLRYLAELLRRPGDRLHLTELAACVANAPLATGGAGGPATEAGVSSRPGDAGEILDERARAAYRARLADLGDALSAAERKGDESGAAGIEREMEALRHELSRAVGLGGRARRAGSDVERLRFRVTKAIKGAIRKLDAADPTLGHHLSTTIHTGAYCTYAPDPAALPDWDL